MDISREQSWEKVKLSTLSNFNFILFSAVSFLNKTMVQLLISKNQFDSLQAMLKQKNVVSHGLHFALESVSLFPVL